MTKRPPDYDRDEMQRMIDLAEDPSSNDRTVAIGCMAHIEDAIAELLRANLEGYDGSSEESLFRGSGPLATFGNRVTMARAMDLITPAFARELKAMAQIRNKFAHKFRVDSFDHPDIQKSVSALTSLAEAEALLRNLFLYPPASTVRKASRAHFCYSAVVAALALNGEDVVMLDRLVAIQRSREG